jgi:hypothetical protein
MGLLSWISGGRTRQFIVNHVNAMLGSKLRRRAAVFALLSNRYLFGYVVGRINVIMQSTSNLSSERRAKLCESILLELFPPEDDEGNGLRIALITKGNREFERGRADAWRVGRYFYGDDYSADPDVTAALAYSKDAHKVAAQFNLNIGKGERQDIVTGLDGIYFHTPFAKALNHFKGFFR